MDFDEAVQNSKKRDNYNYLFNSKTDVSKVYSLLLQGFERSVKEIQCDIPVSSLSAETIL